MQLSRTPHRATMLRSRPCALRALWIDERKLWIMLFIKLASDEATAHMAILVRLTNLGQQT
jgi:hypothetical protein